MKSYIAVLVVALTGCTAIADFAASKLLGGDSGGGINTELVVGDKEQTLGNNMEVKADRVDRVIGSDDNTTNASGAEFVEVNNFSYPSWVVPILFTLAMVFLALPMPGKWPSMIRSLFNRN